MIREETSWSTNTGFSSFGQQQTTGTAVVKYNPLADTDEFVNAGTTTDVNVNIHCITSMEEYQRKSLEELRLEDYVAKRKGPSGVFGTNSIGVGATANTSTTGERYGSTRSTSTRLFGHQKTTKFRNTFNFGYRQSTGTAVWAYMPERSEYLSGHFGSVPLYMRLTIHCITSMKEYESKSLEELRLEDYVAGRKGPSGVFGSIIPVFGQPATTSAPSPFGSSISSTPAFGQTNTCSVGGDTQTNTKAGALSFGANKTAFGAAPTPAFGTTGFGTNTTGSNLFGNNTFGKPPTSQPSFGFNTQPALVKSEQNELPRLNIVTEEKNHLESELHDRKKELYKLPTVFEKLIPECQQQKNEHEIDSGAAQKYQSEIIKVQKQVKILTHQSLSERLGLQQGEEDALREALEEQGTGNGNTVEDLQQREEGSLREVLEEQGAGNGNTVEDLKQREADSLLEALEEQGAGNGNTAEDLKQRKEDSLREALEEQGAGNRNTAEDLQQREEDSLREALEEQGAGNGNTAKDLQHKEEDSLREALEEQGAGNGNTAKDLQQRDEDSLREALEEQGAGNGHTAEDLQQREEDSLREALEEQGAGNGNTAEDLQQREEDSLREALEEQGAGTGNTAKDLQQREEDLLREALEQQGAGNGNTAEDLQQREEDSLRKVLEEQGAGNGNTAKDLQIKINEKPKDTDIILFEKKIKLAEEDAQKALERAESSEKKLEELQQRQRIVTEDRKPGKPNLMSIINYFETGGEKKEIKIEPARLQESTPTSRPPSPPGPPPLPSPPAVFQSSPAKDMVAMLANKSASLKKTKQNGRGAIDAIVDQMKGLKFQLKSTDQNILEKPKNDQPVAVKNMLQIVITLTDKKNIEKLATE